MATPRSIRWRSSIAMPRSGRSTKARATCSSIQSRSCSSTKDGDGMLACVCALSLAASAAVAQGFEGTYTTRKVTLRSEAVEEQVGEQHDKIFDLSIDRLMRLGSSVDTTVMWIKGARFRGQTMEMPGTASAYMIINTATQVMTMVIPAQRSYYEVSLAGASEAAEDAAEPEPTVQPLGR